MKNIKVSRLSKAITLFIVFSAVAAMAATTVLYQHKGVSEFTLLHDDNYGNIIQRNIDEHKVGWQYNEVTRSEDLYLVSVNKKLTEYIDSNGTVSGTLTWNVRRGSRFEIPVWNKSEQATDLNIHGVHPVLTTEQSGCCAEMTGYRLYNYKTGRLLMSFNDFDFEPHATQPFSLEVPNTQLAIRYIGLISQDSTRDRDFLPASPGMVPAVLIKYANEKLKQKIQVDMAVSPGFAVSVMDVKIEPDPAVPRHGEIEINGKQATLWNIEGNSDPSSISGVQLKVVLNGGDGDKILLIPITLDQLNILAAKLPVGLVLKAVP